MSQNLDNIYKAQRELMETTYHHWAEYVLFSFNWWFLISLLIVPWIIWWRFADKKRLLEISLVGSLVMVVALILDTLGASFSLWFYNFKVIPIAGPLISIDLSILPVSHMFLYQWFNRWRAYIIGHTVVASIGSFIVEPLFIWMNIYEMHHWKPIYSFPIYIILGILFRWIVQKVKVRQSL